MLRHRRPTRLVPDGAAAASARLVLSQKRLRSADTRGPVRSGETDVSVGRPSGRNTESTPNFGVQGCLERVVDTMRPLLVQTTVVAVVAMVVQAVQIAVLLALARHIGHLPASLYGPI